MGCWQPSRDLQLWGDWSQSVGDPARALIRGPCHKLVLNGAGCSKSEVIKSDGGCRSGPWNSVLRM